jgi:hypothetical protein
MMNDGTSDQSGAHTDGNPFPSMTLFTPGKGRTRQE